MTGNSAVGSDGDGFWLDFPEESQGSHTTTTICPNEEKLGEFWKNIAHSNNRYGLRIHKSHFPRHYGCEAVDSETNPLVTAEIW